MKTVKEWFDELPQPQRHEAINNVINQCSAEHLLVKKISLNHALKSSFIWDKTDEGFIYWSNILNNELLKSDKKTT